MKNLLKKILNVFDNELLSLTEKGVSKGNKIFGAFILKKKDLSLVTVATNNEFQNPLFHGEISVLMKFYELPENQRPLAKDCLFISSHEPCSLCLSAITWCGFDNFYYLFSYTDTLENYHIPHDLNILKDVFNIKNGKYIKDNSYWKSYFLIDLIDDLSDFDRYEILPILNKIKKTYENLSKKYQLNKKNNSIPLK